MRADDAREAVARLTGQRVTGIRSSGSVHVAELDDGSRVVAKEGSGPGASAAEAAGLRWLAVPGGPPVPAVRGADEHWLVAEHVPGGRTDAAMAEALGRELATLHAAGASAFGAPPDGGPIDAWIGLAPMRNEPERDWPTFYATHRVQPYLRRSVDTGELSAADAEPVERVCEQIAELAGPAEPPARLHGDLWSGNVHPGADGRAWLLDPAAHGGHRETDLAMLQLFGHPHLDTVLAAYSESAPLADGWRERVPLHQLFPLLVHTVLFGGFYAARTVEAARRALRG